MSDQRLIDHQRPVSRMAMFTAVSWLGMFIHNMIELPLTVLSPENSLPTLVSIVLFLGWWLSPYRRLMATMLLGWALLHLIVGGIFSVLPLPIWPFYPEQTAGHYLTHAIYSVAQLPLIALLISQLRSP